MRWSRKANPAWRSRPVRGRSTILQETYVSWRAHRTTRLAAGLAYYGLFALLPLLSVSIALAGVVLDEIEMETRIAEWLTGITGGDADQVAAAIAARVDSTGSLAGLGLIGLGSLLLAASLVFVALQDAFDTIWEIPVGAGARASLRRRALAFSVVLLSGAVLIVGFALSSVAGLVRSLAPGDTIVFDVAADLVVSIGGVALIAVILTALYRFLTRTEVHWRVAFVGGVATAVSLAVVNRLGAEYVRRWGGSSLAGAAGVIVVALVWVYAISQIVLVGAELTRTLERRIGPNPEPGQHD